jgi:hypothetical protein
MPSVQPTYGVRFAQATGMVAAQADCSIGTAVVLIHYRAELIGCSVSDIAASVVRRRVRFNRQAPGRERSVSRSRDAR